MIEPAEWFALGVVAFFCIGAAWGAIVEAREKRRRDFAFAVAFHDPTHNVALRNGLGYCVVCGSPLGG